MISTYLNLVIPVLDNFLHTALKDLRSGYGAEFSAKSVPNLNALVGDALTRYVTTLQMLQLLDTKIEGLRDWFRDYRDPRNTPKGAIILPLAVELDTRDISKVIAFTQALLESVSAIPLPAVEPTTPEAEDGPPPAEEVEMGAALPEGTDDTDADEDDNLLGDDIGTLASQEPAGPE